MNRHASLDYLRGLMAVAIMVYHHHIWTFGSLDSSSALGRLGIYGVSVFYVLSGLTLYVVYKNKFAAPWLGSTLSFAVKRIFRIFPLLWLIVLLTILLRGSVPDYKVIILNLTGLFGFIRPTAYIGVGVWSIGNELVFYAFFPIAIYIAKKSTGLFVVILLITVGIHGYISFFLLTRESGLIDQWGTYINPLNQIVLFMGGIAIGILRQYVGSLNKRLYILLFIITIGLFVYIPTNGDPINIVSGFESQIFILLAYSICLTFYFGSFSFSGVPHTFLSFLGESCYSIYLLHPIIYKMLQLSIGNLLDNNITLMLISILFTLIMSRIVYKYFEQPFMNLGKKLAVKVEHV